MCQGGWKEGNAPSGKSTSPTNLSSKSWVSSVGLVSLTSSVTLMQEQVLDRRRLATGLLARLGDTETRCAYSFVALGCWTGMADEGMMETSLVLGREQSTVDRGR